MVKAYNKASEATKLAAAIVTAEKVATAAADAKQVRPLPSIVIYIHTYILSYPHALLLL